VVRVSLVALIAADLVLTYSVIVRYFLKISTDWQDEMSVFLIRCGDAGGFSTLRKAAMQGTPTSRKRA
jgi:hypothetical protein